MKGSRSSVTTTAQFLSAPSTPALKKCPDCAEDVSAEARKCRFCGFEFLPEEAQPDEEQQSKGGRVVKEQRSE
jgi:rubredoxin